jgi:hypothetical protein
MKINLGASHTGLELQKILKLTLSEEKKTHQGTEYVFDAPSLNISKAEALSIKIKNKYGSRCVGAYPSGTDFIVVLKTGLTLVK